MDFARISACVIIGVAVAVILYDLIPALNKTDNDTVSEVMRLLSMMWWILPFGFHVLGGHFWGFLHEPLYKGTGWIMLVLGLIAIAINVLGPRGPWGPAQWYPVMIVGHMCGALLWPVQVNEGEVADEATTSSNQQEGEQ